MQIDKNLYDEINEFCQMNDLKTKDFIHKILKEVFLKEKYGETPFKKKEPFITPIVIEEKNILNTKKVLEEVVDDVIEEENSESITITPTVVVTPEGVKPKVKKKRTLK